MNRLPASGTAIDKADYRDNQDMLQVLNVTYQTYYLISYQPLAGLRIAERLSLTAGFEAVRDSNVMVRVTDRDARANAPLLRGVFLHNNASFGVL